jgi:hypothetical protein
VKKVVTYDRDTKELLDYQVYSTPILASGGVSSEPWELSFTMSALSGATTLSLDALSALAQRLSENTTAFDLFYQQVSRMRV